MKAFGAIIETKMQRTWDLDLIDEVFSGDESSDEFTYTMRLTIPKGRRREKIRAQLQKRGHTDLIELMDKNDWDVSFLVDCW